jgi:hypothetical protein
MMAADDCYVRLIVSPNIMTIAVEVVRSCTPRTNDFRIERDGDILVLTFTPDERS